MPSFQDSVVLFILALLLFGPKRLPVLAREIGKWLGEFRRASNEFKMQMEDELRAHEHTEQQKKIAAMEAAAPPPALPAPEHPHDEPALATEAGDQMQAQMQPHPSATIYDDDLANDPSIPPSPVSYDIEPAPEAPAPVVEARAWPEEIAPLPIAEAGELKMMPPATGLPRGRTRNLLDNEADPLGGLMDAIPSTPDPEEAAHGR